MLVISTCCRKGVVLCVIVQKHWVLCVKSWLSKHDKTIGQTKRKESKKGKASKSQYFILMRNITRMFTALWSHPSRCLYVYYLARPLSPSLGNKLREWLPSLSLYHGYLLLVTACCSDQGFKVLLSFQCTHHVHKDTALLR